MNKESFGQTIKEQEDEKSAEKIQEDISEDVFGLEDEREEDEVEASTGTFKQKPPLEKLTKTPSKQRLLSARD